MPKTWRYVSVAGIVAAAACARSVPTGSPETATDNNPSTPTAPGSPTGSADPSQVGADASPITIRDASTAPDQGNDGGPMLSADGSVGLCVSGRTCQPPTCDELQENGQHEYIEQHPDDGSQIPAKDVATVSKLFAGSAATTSGPCIAEPPDGALFPNNWVRARIRFIPAGANQTIFQIRIHADRQANDLIVYTESKTWEIPKDIWTALAASTWGEDITVTVSSVAAGGGAVTSSQAKFEIAPAFANGSIIYWTAVGKDKPSQAWLESFGVGDENVAIALTTPQVKWSQARLETGNLQNAGAADGLPAGAPACIGCHVAVPDRQTVTFIEDWPWDGVASMVDPTDTGNLPTWLTPGGAEALSMPWLGMMAFSPHVWNDLKQHIMVVALQGESRFTTSDAGGGPAPIAPWGYQGSNEWDTSPNSQLGWIDLSTAAPPIAPADGGAISGDQLSLGMAANYGTSWGIIARTGDTSGVAAPTWSHLAGDTIVYTSTNASMSGRVGTGTADLWSVPYAAGAGGSAMPIPGASDAKWNEYYPSFSPDDRFIAFNRTPVGESMYYDPHSEVFVIPTAGGTATRLNANDPPACTGEKSPGITNSWPKWAPEYPACNGQQFYWLIFSSSRDGKSFAGGSVTSQLYLTALVESDNVLKSYPGVFIWNQHTVSTVAPYVGQQQSNHTPQWEGINLPTPPPPPAPPPPQQPPT